MARPPPAVRCARAHPIRSLPPPPPPGTSAQVVCRGSPPTHPLAPRPPPVAGCVFGVACPRASHRQTREAQRVVTNGRVGRGTDVRTGSSSACNTRPSRGTQSEWRVESHLNRASLPCGYASNWGAHRPKPPTRRTAHPPDLCWAWDPRHRNRDGRATTVRPPPPHAL